MYHRIRSHFIPKRRPFLGLAHNHGFINEIKKVHQVPVGGCQACFMQTEPSFDPNVSRFVVKTKRNSSFGHYMG